MTAGVQLLNSSRASGHKKSPTTRGCWAQCTIKGEIDETKPTTLNNIYLHTLRLWRSAKVPIKSKKALLFT